MRSPGKPGSRVKLHWQGKALHVRRNVRYARSLALINCTCQRVGPRCEGYIATWTAASASIPAMSLLQCRKPLFGAELNVASTWHWSWRCPTEWRCRRARRKRAVRLEQLDRHLLQPHANKSGNESYAGSFENSGSTDDEDVRT